MNSFSQNTVLQSSARQLTAGGTDPLLPKLVHAINHADEIEITVSFIQPSGLALLFDPLLEALRSGAQLRLLTSDYLDITSPVALRELMTLVERGAYIRIYESDTHQSFHMKSYIFVKTQQNSAEIAAGCAFIGSNNISRSALTTGLEWCFRHDYTIRQAAREPANSIIFAGHLLSCLLIITLRHSAIAGLIPIYKDEKRRSLLSPVKRKMPAMQSP